MNATPALSTNLVTKPINQAAPNYLPVESPSQEAVNMLPIIAPPLFSVARYDPESQEAERFLAMLYSPNESNETKVEQETANYLSTKSLVVLSEIADRLYQYGNFELAREFFDEIIARGPKLGDYHSNFTVANAMALTANYQGAIERYQEVINYSYDEKLINEAHLALASLYTALYQYEEAFAEVNKISDQEQYSASAIRLTYQCLKGMGQIGPAVKFLHYALSETEKQSGKEFASKDSEWGWLYIETGEFTKAENIAAALLAEDDYNYSAMILLAQVYQKTNKIKDLTELAEKFKELGYYQDYLSFNYSVILDTLANAANTSPLETEQLKKESALFASELNNSYQAKLTAFPTPLALYEKILTDIHTTGLIDLEALDSLKESVPANAFCFKMLVENLEYFRIRHWAGATGQPIKFNGYTFQYRPLAKYSPLGTSITIDPFISSTLSGEYHNDLPQYYIANSDTLLSLLRKNNTPLSQLSPQAAIYYIAKVTEDIVDKYDSLKTFRADLTNDPLEEKIQRGDFNYAVCRHYTPIFIALFNALKKINPNLDGYYAIADFSPNHTFPTVFTVQANKQVIFTSLDPTTDDLTPQFNDRLEVSPLSDFQLEAALSELIEQAQPQVALVIVKDKLKQPLSSSDRVMLFDCYFKLLQNTTATEADWLDLLKQVQTNKATLLPASQEADALTVLSIIEAKIYSILKKPAQVLALIDKVKNAPPNWGIEVNSLSVYCWQALGKKAALKEFAQKRNTEVSGLVSQGTITSPLLPYLKTGTPVNVKINEEIFPVKVDNGKLLLPKELRISLRQANGYLPTLIINPD